MRIPYKSIDSQNSRTSTPNETNSQTPSQTQKPIEPGESKSRFPPILSAFTKKPAPQNKFNDREYAMKRMGSRRDPIRFNVAQTKMIQLLAENSEALGKQARQEFGKLIIEDGDNPERQQSLESVIRQRIEFGAQRLPFFSDDAPQ